MDLSALGPIIGQIVLQAWNQVIYPKLQTLEGEIGSAHLQVVAEALLGAINSIVQTEAPKI